MSRWLAEGERALNKKICVDVDKFAGGKFTPVRVFVHALARGDRRGGCREIGGADTDSAGSTRGFEMAVSLATPGWPLEQEQGMGFGIAQGPQSFCGRQEQVQGVDG